MIPKPLRLTPKFALVYVLFAAILLISVGIFAYYSGRNSLESAAVSDLLSRATEKEATLNFWIAERQSNLKLIAISPHVLNALDNLIHPLNSTTMQSAHEQLVTELKFYALEDLGFPDLFIMNISTGEILVSTDPEQEGVFNEDRPYFINGKNGLYIQNPYYSLSLQAPTMTMAIPLRSGDGQLLGVLAGQLDLSEMNAIIARRSGQQQTDDAFLVNSANLFITQPRFLSDPVVLQQGIHTEAVTRCLAAGSGVVYGDDYRGVPAIVVYRWLAERQLCLIVKIDLTEALEPVQSFGLALAGVGGLALFAASLVGIALARTLTRPILALQAGVMRFGQGEMDMRLPERTHDELGLLAHEFNDMAAAIAEKDTQLRTYAAQLEQKVAERTAELQASEAELRAIFTAMDDVILVFDSAGHLRKIAPTNSSVRFKPPPERLDQTLYQILPSSADADKLMDNIQQALMAGKTIHTEYAQTIRAGEIWLAITISPMQADTVLWVARDITERKQTEHELAQTFANAQAARVEAVAARDRLAFLLQASTLLAESFDHLTRLKQFAQFVVPRIADWCTLHMVDTDGSVKQVALTHVDPAKIAWAEELQRRFPPDPNARQGVYQVVQSGQAEFYPEITEAMLAASIRDPELLRLAQAIGFTSAMTVPLVANERVVGVITLVMAESGRHFGQYDLELVTDLARRAALLIENARLYEETKRFNLELEARVEERTAQLQAANKELEAFSYSVSHDLRAPLRAMRGFSGILIRDHSSQLTPEAARHLARIAENAERMGQLIDDLLAFSRLGRQPLKRENVAPTSIVRQVLDELAADQENRPLALSIADLPVCWADPALLKQVYVNLLSNALKFTRSRMPAQIEINYERVDGETIYFVKDNGAGFDMRYANKLFGVFQRLHRPDEFEGTGVGLAIVQRIVNRHDGRIWAEAEVDHGATFFFTLGASDD